LYLKLLNICLVWLLAVEAKSENDQSETEHPQEVAAIKETEEVAARSESNGEDSEPKQETVQENDSKSGQTFSYDQLKARSDNPATGIDFKRREVGSVKNVFILFHMWNLY
jgi:hypothetical protein